MVTMTKRVCRRCTTILRQSNESDLCWVCDRKAFDEWLKNPQPDKNPGYTRDQLILALHEYVHRHGRTPGRKSCEGIPSESVYRRYFGTWSGALKAAGLAEHRSGPPISESRMAILRALEDGPMAMREIADVTGLTRVVVNKQLARMEKAGQVHRTEEVKLDGPGGKVWIYALGGDE